MDRPRTPQARRRMRGALEQAGLHGEAIWVDRILALATGKQKPIDQKEVRLAGLVRIVGLMNTVAIANRVEPDEAHDTVDEDTGLKERCAALRAVAG